MLAQLNQHSGLVIRELSSEMLDELIHDILPFWAETAMDREKGGFYGEIGNDLTIRQEAGKGAILHARILWTFSSAYRILGDDRCVKAADHAYAFIEKHLWDPRFGGIYWMAGPRGEVLNDRKQAYNLAFAIYGLTEYHRATGRPDALAKAAEVFAILENHFKDKRYGGYFEALSRDYSPVNDVRLSEKDRNDAKSMNTHLHLLEAYTNLYRIWRSESLKLALGDLLDIMLNHIVDGQFFRFNLFFDEAWRCSSPIVSYGHDIEGSWLMCEAADVLGDERLKERVYACAVKMAYGVLEHGVDREYGGLFNEEEHGHMDTDKHWWPQAEAVVGFINAYELTQDERFLEAACQTWSFIQSHILDRENGEWFWKTDRVGKPYAAMLKVEPWKCPYHNGRACLEILTRERRMAETSLDT